MMLFYEKHSYIITSSEPYALEFYQGDLINLSSQGTGGNLDCWTKSGSYVLALI